MDSAKKRLNRIFPLEQEDMSLLTIKNMWFSSAVSLHMLALSVEWKIMRASLSSHFSFLRNSRAFLHLYFNTY